MSYHQTLELVLTITWFLVNYITQCMIYTIMLCYKTTLNLAITLSLFPQSSSLFYDCISKKKYIIIIK